MSNSFIELELFENINNLSNFYPDELNFSNNISDISKIVSHYHLFCKECNRVPIIRFNKKNKIKYICECKESPRELMIKDIDDYLLYSDNIDIEEKKLKCYLHSEEKYSSYCLKCKKNRCSKCVSNDCIDHKDKIQVLYLDNNIIYKCKYIIEKINYYIDDNNKNYEFDNDDEDNISNYKFISEQINTDYEKNNKNTKKKEFFIIKKDNKDIINDDKKEEIINIINENNNEGLYEDEYYYLKLFAIVINDFKNYPNFNHFETISNIEQFIILSYGDFHDINLIYEFEEENIQNNSIELFGEIFVNNNYENCFLIINEKIMKLSRYINLSDIFDNYNLITNWPIILDIKLIIKKCKLTIDLSFMFYGISTISSKTIFKNINNIKIIKMSYMFYNCSSLKQLPDISEINTSNVTDMSYMFYNCSSLKQLPDISKWDTQNVMDISHIFQNCELLTSLPNISIWKTDNVKNMVDIFKNCKSLSNIPNISNWKINKENEDNSIFEGCTLLEENIKKQNSEFVFDCLKCYINICDKTLPVFRLFILSVIIILFSFYYLYLIFIPIFNCFNLDKLNEGLTDPIKKFDLIKYTNISYIIDILNITNSTKILTINQNKEDFINNITNFTLINGNVKFESSQNILIIYNTVHTILFIIKILLFIAIFFRKKINFVKSKIILLSILLIILNIISIIFEILDFSYSLILLHSLSKFSDRISKLFRIDIPKIYKNEIEKIHNFASDGANFIISIILIIYSILIYAIKLNKKLSSKSYKDYLTILNNIIK